MKNIIAVTILTIAVNALCIWDIFYTKQVFSYMLKQSSAIHETLLTKPIDSEEVGLNIINLDEYWTKRMDVLCVSISRKDLQPISDHLQFLKSSITNNDQESAITYSLLLRYNIEGLKEISGFSFVNIL